MYYRIILSILPLALFITVFQTGYTEDISDTKESYITMSGTLSTVYSVLDKGDNIYKDVVMWYKENNRKTTILPDILRVPIIDFFAVLLGVFLVFWCIFRFLSR